MENDFIPYIQALELKKLGFEEPCYGKYVGTIFSWGTLNSVPKNYNLDYGPHTISAPMWFQAFSFLMKKANITSFGRQFALEYENNQWYFIEFDVNNGEMIDISEGLYAITTLLKKIRRQQLVSQAY